MGMFDKKLQEALLAFEDELKLAAQVEAEKVQNIEDPFERMTAAVNARVMWSISQVIATLRAK